VTQLGIHLRVVLIKNEQLYSIKAIHIGNVIFINIYG